MPVGTSRVFLAITLVLFCKFALGSSPSDLPVAVWIESPKQNDKVYYYVSDNPTFNATVRLHRRPNAAIGALSLNVFFQGALVAEVAAESDVVIISPRNAHVVFNVPTPGFALVPCFRCQCHPRGTAMRQTGFPAVD